MTVEGLMRKPEHSGEPSIEEILASIRSIIAEDGTSPRLGAKPVTDSAARRPAPVHENRQDIESEASSAKQERAGFQRGLKASITADSGEEILELTEDFMLAEPAAAQSGSDPKPRTA